MKLIYTLSFLLLSFTSIAQYSWWCVQPNVERYFTNENGYLRGIRIDSLKSAGSITTLYPFKSPRGYYLNGQKLKPSGSWAGETITIEQDGTHYFDNFWGDTVIIKTQAGLNDTWIFFNDTTDGYYTATVTLADTLTVLGVLDSVKEITIAAYNISGVNSNDPLHNARLIISKDHGFVWAFDLFIFPMHEPNKVYQDGFDYWLHSIIGGSLLNNGVFFNLVNFHNPDWTEIYDYNVGDIYLKRIIISGGPWIDYNLETIAGKIVSSTGLTFVIKSWYQRYNPMLMKNETKVIVDTFTISSGKLFDTTKMPEEWGVEIFHGYRPSDTQFCTKGLYMMASNFIYDSVVNTFEPCGTYRWYKGGLGRIYYYRCEDPMPNSDYDEMLSSYYKNGKACGPYPTLDIPNIDNFGDEVVLYPNPASEILNIRLPYVKNEQFTTCFYSMTGALMKSVTSMDRALEIPISDLPSGLYYINIKLDSGAVINSKVTVHR